MFCVSGIGDFPHCGGGIHGVYVDDVESGRRACRRIGGQQCDFYIACFVGTQAIHGVFNLGFVGTGYEAVDRAIHMFIELYVVSSNGGAFLRFFVRFFLRWKFFVVAGLWHG